MTRTFFRKVLLLLSVALVLLLGFGVAPKGFHKRAEPAGSALQAMAGSLIAYRL